MRIIEIATVLGLPCAVVLTGCGGKDTTTAATATTETTANTSEATDNGHGVSVQEDHTAEWDDYSKSVMQNTPTIPFEEIGEYKNAQDFDNEQYERAQKGENFLTKMWTVFKLANHYQDYKNEAKVEYKHDPKLKDDSANDQVLADGAAVVARAVKDKEYLGKAETKTFWLDLWYEYLDEMADWKMQHLKNESTVSESLRSGGQHWLEFFRKCYNDHFGTNLTQDDENDPWNKPGTFTDAKNHRLYDSKDYIDLKVQKEGKSEQNAFTSLKDRLHDATKADKNVDVVIASDKIGNIRRRIQYVLVFDEKESNIKGTSKDDSTPAKYKTIIISSEGKVNFGSGNGDDEESIYLEDFYFVLHLDFSDFAFNTVMADHYRRWTYVKDGQIVNKDDIEYIKKDGTKITLENKPSIRAKAKDQLEKDLQRILTKRTRSKRVGEGTMAPDNTPATTVQKRDEY